jgi:hypothetical protein
VALAEAEGVAASDEGSPIKTPPPPGRADETDAVGAAAEASLEAAGRAAVVDDAVVADGLVGLAVDTVAEVATTA